MRGLNFLHIVWLVPCLMLATACGLFDENAEEDARFSPGASL